MESLNTLFLIGIFASGAIATWIAGVYLSRTTDALDFRWKLGDALGGMILLSVSGSLPEVAITITAAAQHNLQLAAGNLIGGIAMQTMVLAICDMKEEAYNEHNYDERRYTDILQGLGQRTARGLQPWLAAEC